MPHSNSNHSCCVPWLMYSIKMLQQTMSGIAINGLSYITQTRNMQNGKKNIWWTKRSFLHNINFYCVDGIQSDFDIHLLLCWNLKMYLHFIYRQISNYMMCQIQKLKCFSSHLAVVFAQSVEARCKVENEEVVGAAPTGDAPTTSE